MGRNEALPMAQDEHHSIHALASSIARRGLAVPAILLLELMKPLSFFCSQALLGIDPLLSPLAAEMGRRWAWLLEDRHRIDGLLEVLATPGLATLASDRKEDECNP